MRLLFLILLMYYVPVSAQEPSKPSVMKLLSARQFDDYQGDARIKQVEQLRKNDWQALDSIYGLPDQNGHRPLEIIKTDLAPYVDNDGYIVFLVPEVAPQFPGGEKALKQFKRDVLFPFIQITNPDDNYVSNAVYIRFTVNSDGQITDVVEAQPHSEGIPKALAEQCLDAVKYMPVWEPGLFHGKPVRTCMLIIF